MPKLVNHNDHAVRVRDDEGRAVRLRPGQVMEADGSTADALSGVGGVETASKEDEDAYAAQNEPLSTEPQEDESAIDLYARARVVGKQLLISLPLQRVIGDDAAPYGPPTGTVTTKQALAAESDEMRRRFADHERLPEDADNEALREQSTVESDQADNIAQLDEAREQLEEAHAERKAEHDQGKADKAEAKSAKKSEKSAAKE